MDITLDNIVKIFLFFKFFFNIFKKSLDYISVDESGLVNLQMMFRESYARRFDIHIEQLECDSKDIGKDSN